MLLTFRTTNYKSFKDELIFSLVPAPKQNTLEYSVIEKSIGETTSKGLCSAVFYGSNASGKTTLIGALETFKSIILRGNIRNNVNANTSNDAAKLLELIPNNSLENTDPVCFSIEFIEENRLVEYSLAMDIGGFLEEQYPRKVLTETLTIDGVVIFHRNENVEISNLNCIADFLINAFEENSGSAIALAKNNLDDKELFLMNGFKTLISSKLVTLITSWLVNKLTVIYHGDFKRTIHKFSDPNLKFIADERILNEAAAIFGINSNELVYLLNSESNDIRLYSSFRDMGGPAVLPADVFESRGTLRFIDMFSFIADVINYGGTLVVDEIDASINPKVMMNIVNMFHNDEINIHGAQLIFNTHNPIYLNSNLFRRDEIKFIDRDDDTHCSNLYSLSDFDSEGSTTVSKNDEYMMNYMNNRYGATKDIDLTPVFENTLFHSNEA